MKRFFPVLALLLMSVNLVFVLFVGRDVALHWSEWRHAEPIDLNLGPDPAGHLPLAGMGGARYTPEENCLRLNGFLLDMIHLLSIHGVATIPPAKAQSLVASGNCTMDDPDVAEAVNDVKRAYETTGLPPIFEPGWMP